MRRNVGRTFFFKQEVLFMYAAIINAVHTLCETSETVEAKKKVLSAVEVGAALCRYVTAFKIRNCFLILEKLKIL